MLDLAAQTLRRWRLGDLGGLVAHMRRWRVGGHVWEWQLKQLRAREDGKQYTTATDSGFEPTFRDFSAMVRVRARSGEKHRRRGAAPLENFNGQIHVFKRHFLSQNNMHSVHNQCIRSILAEICP